MLLPEGTARKAYKGTFPKGESKQWGSILQSHSHYLRVVTFQWTQDNHRMSFSMVDVLLVLLENRNPSAVRL